MADDPAPYVPPFELHSSRSIRRHGIRGRRVSVALGEGALFIAGADGARVLEIPLDSIQRMLVGSDRHRAFVVHRLQLWTAEHGSIVLKARNAKDNIALYAHLIGNIARWMDRKGRLSAVRIGLPRLPALVAPFIVGGGLVAVAFLDTPAANLRATTREEYLLGGLVLLLILAVATGAAFRQGFHRRVATPEALDRFVARA